MDGRNSWGGTRAGRNRRSERPGRKQRSPPAPRSSAQPRAARQRGKPRTRPSKAERHSWRRSGARPAAADRRLPVCARQSTKGAQQLGRAPAPPAAWAARRGAQNRLCKPFSAAKVRDWSTPSLKIALRGEKNAHFADSLLRFGSICCIMCVTQQEGRHTHEGTGTQDADAARLDE